MSALEKILEEIENISLGEYYIEAEKVKEIIRKHMNDGWIPKKQNLPEEGERVWITTKTDYVKVGTYTCCYGSRKGVMCSGKFVPMSDVTAWQPYIPPRPYRPA